MCLLMTPPTVNLTLNPIYADIVHVLRLIYVLKLHSDISLISFQV